MKHEAGQSLVELLIAMGIFVLAVSAISSLILDVYLSDRVGREKMIATFLAKEGMEAVRSIRDSNWQNLTNGEYGLAILGGNWVFQGNQEEVSAQLRDGVRKIIVEEMDANRKKITSQIIWKLTEARSQEVSLVTYLTNWKATTAAESCDIDCQWEGYTGGGCELPAACPDENELGGLGEYDCTANKVCCCK